MKKRLSWVTLLVAAIGLATFCVWNFRRSEPVYQGKSVSEWFGQFHAVRAAGRGLDEEAEEEAVRALRTIGTNAVPYLVRAAFSPVRDSMLRNSFERIWRRLHPTSAPILMGEGIRGEAAYVLRRIRPPAKTILPLLTDALHGADVPDRRQALILLGTVGEGAEEGVPYLTAALKSRASSFRMAISGRPLESGVMQRRRTQKLKSGPTGSNGSGAEPMF